MGFDVGLDVGGFVSPSSVGDDDIGDREGFPDGEDVGMLVVGRNVGWPVGREDG